MVSSGLRSFNFSFMSKIQSFTSAQRGSIAATAGEIYLESDTNKLLLYLGKNTWKEIECAGRSLPNSYVGGADDLHYPDGLFSNSAATYYIDTSPMFHYDSSYLGGSSFPFKSFFPDESLYTIGDRSGKGRNCSRDPSGSSTLATVDLGISSTLSSGSKTMPAISSAGGYFGLNAFAMPRCFTGFFVQCSRVSTNMHVTPFSSYSRWYTRPNGDCSFGDTTTAPGPSTALTSGPFIRIGRTNSSTVEQWTDLAGVARSPHVSASQISRAVTNNILTGLLHNSTSYYMYTWEIIGFAAHLDISSINMVKDYLENKYNGIKGTDPTSTPIEPTSLITL